MPRTKAERKSREIIHPLWRPEPPLTAKLLPLEKSRSFEASDLKAMRLPREMNRSFEASDLQARHPVIHVPLTPATPKDLDD